MWKKKIKVWCTIFGAVALLILGIIFGRKSTGKAGADGTDTPVDLDDLADRSELVGNTVDELGEAIGDLGNELQDNRSEIRSAQSTMGRIQAIIEEVNRANGITPKRKNL